MGASAGAPQVATTPCWWSGHNAFAARPFGVPQRPSCSCPAASAYVIERPRGWCEALFQQSLLDGGPPMPVERPCSCWRPESHLPQIESRHHQKAAGSRQVQPWWPVPPSRAADRNGSSVDARAAPARPPAPESALPAAWACWKRLAGRVAGDPGWSFKRGAGFDPTMTPAHRRPGAPSRGAPGLRPGRAMLCAAGRTAWGCNGRYPACPCDGGTAACKRL